ncbi:MAG: hypothetical protein SOZ00_01760 [Tidjanibacter sp.]|nr:hypothetical protein [Tidjanibacter sp.]
MKRFILSIALMAGIFSGAAQVIDDGESLTIIKSNGDDMIRIEPDRQGDVVIKIAGYAISFGNDKLEKPSKHRRYSQFGKEVDGKIGLLEIGASMLTSPDYSAYTAAQNGFMDLDASKSFHIALNTLSTSVSLSPRGHLRFSTALSLVWDNYVISNTRKLSVVDGVVTPATLDGARKSKLATFSLRMPLFLEVDLFGSSFLSAGVYGEWVNAWTKYKSPKTKSTEIDKCINPLRWGFAAKLGITDGLYLVGDYCCTNLFRDNRGPATTPLSIGIGMLF